MENKTCEVTKLMDHMCEFPLVNQNHYGKKYRYAYLMQVAKPGEVSREEAKNLLGKGWIKYDILESKIID